MSKIKTRFHFCARRLIRVNRRRFYLRPDNFFSGFSGGSTPDAVGRSRDPSTPPPRGALDGGEPPADKLSRAADRVGRRTARAPLRAPRPRES